MTASIKSRFDDLIVFLCEESVLKKVRLAFFKPSFNPIDVTASAADAHIDAYSKLWIDFVIVN